MGTETFPIDLSKLQPLKLDPAVTTLTSTGETRTLYMSNLSQLDGNLGQTLTQLGLSNGAQLLVMDRKATKSLILKYT